MSHPLFATVDARRDDLLHDLFALLRYPSISGLPENAGDVAACADHLAAYCRGLGLTAEVLPTRGHPVVLARTPAQPGKPRVLVYGHYDVQPVTPLEQWDTDPFVPELIDGDIRARGATDDKGQLFTHLAAVGLLVQQGQCPVNVTFLLEGEEEIGSPQLGEVLDKKQQELACDCIVISDTAQYGPGQPAICYGLRGLVVFEVTLTGPAGDLHSGSYGGAVENPANVLARLMAGLQDADGRIAVEGVYDDVRPLTGEERELLGKLPFDEAAYCRRVGVGALGGEQDYTVLERVWTRPTLDINGLVAGHTGEGPKTIIPSRATAKFSMRLVPDQDPVEIRKKVVRHLEERCPQTVKLSVDYNDFARPALAMLDAPPVQAAAEAIRQGFGTEPLLIREGGSIPIVAELTHRLDAPCLLLGFGLPDDRAHAPNEKFNVEDFFRGIKTSIALLCELGRTR